MSEEAEVLDAEEKVSLPVKVSRPSGFIPATLPEAMEMASQLANSGLLPVALRGRPQDVLVVLMRGHELGLGPMQSISNINVIQGKGVCSADLMMALCTRDKSCKRFRPSEMTDEKVTYEVMREGDPEPTFITYTLQDAAAAGLHDKPNWKKFRQEMLTARCKAKAARAMFPELTMGVYTHDEADEFKEPPRPIGKMPAIAKATETYVAGKDATAERFDKASKKQAEADHDRKTGANDPTGDAPADLMKRDMQEHCGGDFPRATRLMQLMGQFKAEMDKPKGWGAMTRDKWLAATNRRYQAHLKLCADKNCPAKLEAIHKEQGWVAVD